MTSGKSAASKKKDTGAEAKTVIKFDHVTKIYRLYRNEKRRLMSVFSKKVPYKEKRAVDDVTFHVKQGESVALFGRNGAGKSTILKMITGVAYPTSGNIEVEGRVSALLELTAGFDSEMTGRENIYLRAQLLGIKDSETARREKAIVNFAELDEYIDQPVRTYSSGMKARLGFAINVNIEPEIFIVDEALSVGDAAFKNKCVEKVRDIIDKDNVTLLFVTHVAGTAKEFCRRGIVLKNGKMVCDTNIDAAVARYEKILAGRKARKAKAATGAGAAGVPEGAKAAPGATGAGVAKDAADTKGAADAKSAESAQDAEGAK